MSTLSTAFVALGGGVAGREHRRALRDGQDGVAVVGAEHVVAGIVTDGCSSGRTSEIGARLGAAWLAVLIAEHFRDVRSEEAAQAAACSVTVDLLARLELLARSLDADAQVRSALVGDALLFTFLAAVVTPSVAVIFGIGDGVVVVEREISVLDPGPDNAPPYIAYGLLGAPLAPRVHFVGPTAGVGLLAVATDGLAAETSLPALAADPRLARNPSLLRKRLVVLSDEGHFADDATVAVVRRREVPS